MSYKEHAFKQAVIELKVIPSFILEDLSAKQASTLIRLYTDQPLPVDKLPYSRIFESMVEVFNELTHPEMTPYVVFGYLVALRKGGRLPLKKS